MKLYFFAVVLGLLSCCQANAEIVLSLDQLSQAGNPGQTLIFTGTILNGGVSDVYLNGLSFNVASRDLTFDGTPFFTYAPLSLSGGSSYSGPLFDIIVDASPSPGMFVNTFALLGGQDSVTFDEVAATNFTVSVNSVPEPASITLLASGIIGVLGVSGRRLLDGKPPKASSVNPWPRRGLV